MSLRLVSLNVIHETVINLYNHGITFFFKVLQIVHHVHTFVENHGLHVASAELYGESFKIKSRTLSQVESNNNNDNNRELIDAFGNSKRFTT